MFSFHTRTGDELTSFVLEQIGRVTTADSSFVSTNHIEKSNKTLLVPSNCNCRPISAGFCLLLPVDNFHKHTFRAFISSILRQNMYPPWSQPVMIAVDYRAKNISTQPLRRRLNPIDRTVSTRFGQAFIAHGRTSSSRSHR